MSATAHWVRAGEEAPMERAALGKLIASCPGHDLTTLDKPGEPGEAGEEAAPVVVAAGEWKIEMPTDYVKRAKTSLNQHSFNSQI